jgi:hypothetical protein
MRAGASAYIGKPIDPSQFRHRLLNLMELAELESRRALLDEQLAIDEELQRRAADATARMGRAKVTAARAIERSVRLKALAQYLAAGGTRVHFEPAFSVTFSSAWATYDPQPKVVAVNASERGSRTEDD